MGSPPDLKDNVQTDVQASRPTTLTMVIRLAKLYKARDNKKSVTQLFHIEACWEEGENDVEMEIDDEIQEVVPEISLHAIIGVQAPKTMKVLGEIRGQSVIALINSGSTPISSIH
ncbi:hypothetical protein JRO89_XS06G0208300 [Xanthoceras sorbifolium]|uniref:Uncharacterized protein n=1 Tax=Xanthoceras sorbifolium TaxID=99658 RepID=A0ABQ8HZ59_9ROSI|nr:hypothetical protein JRO89_XS06G0208300 [Xanthoceras sorbifolium]